jgi:flagella basal body P-ring formation protein FlgA
MKIIVMLAAFVFPLGGNGQAEPPTELRLRSTVAARGLTVTIGELCEFAAGDGPTLALGRITFGPAPTSGYTRTISRTEVVQALAAAGVDLSTLKLTGADETVVQAVSVEVDSAELLECATTALQAQLQIEGGDVEFEAPAGLRHVHAPPGRVGRDLKARVRGARTGPNSAVVDVEILVDGAAHRKVPVAFKLHRYHNVLKATSALRAGTPLGPDNLAIARERIDQVTGMFLDQFDQVEGMTAARNLQAGQRLTLGDTAPPAVIKKGDIVTVVLTRGRVRVTAKAMANHDAPLAGRITLTNLQSRSTLTGLVLAAGLVDVQP